MLHVFIKRNQLYYFELSLFLYIMIICFDGVLILLIIVITMIFIISVNFVFENFQVFLFHYIPLVKCLCSSLRGLPSPFMFLLSNSYY